MKHLKILSLAVGAFMAFLALSAPASATVLSSSGGNLPAGTALQLSSSGTISYTTTGGTIIGTCTGSSLAAKTTTAGGEGAKVSAITEKAGLTWTGCTKTTDTLEGGELVIAYTSGVSGTVTAKNFKWTWEMAPEFGGTCSFTFGTSTTLGTLSGSVSGTTDASLAINALINGASGNSFLCPGDLKMVANYTVTKPTPLMVTSK